MALGGGNLTTFVTIATDHSDVGVTTVISVNENITSTLNRDDNGGYGIEVETIKDDPAMTAFVETYAPPLPEGAAEEVTLEDGTIKGGATAGSPDIVGITYGPTVGTDRKMTISIVKLASTSGSFQQTANTFTRPSLTSQAQRAKAVVTLATTLFDSTMVNPAAAIEIPAGSRGFVTWIPLP